jgi:hypothetical protein
MFSEAYNLGEPFEPEKVFYAVEVGGPRSGALVEFSQKNWESS